MSDLLFAKTDLAGTSAGVADGEHCHGMAFAAVALGTSLAVVDDSLEQGAAEDVSGVGEAGDEVIAFDDSGLMFHY